MRVLHQPLRAGQPIAAAITPLDAGLHECRARVGEHRRHGAAKPIGGGHEIGIENRDVRCIADRHAGRERTRLEATTIGAAHVLDINSFTTKSGDRVQRDIGSNVGAVVEQLYGQAITWPVETRRSRQCTLDHEWFIIDRELHQYPWQIQYRGI